MGQTKQPFHAVKVKSSTRHIPTHPLAVAVLALVGCGWAGRRWASKRGRGVLRLFTLARQLRAVQRAGFPVG